MATANIGVGFLTYYNVDMWQQLGLKDAPPETLDELVQFAQAGTTADTWGYVGEGTNKSRPTSGTSSTSTTTALTSSTRT